MWTWIRIRMWTCTRIWTWISVFLLWMSSGGHTLNRIEYTPAEFHEKLLSGKMMFIYFEQKASPTVSLFLVELEKSAEALRDYGVLVGKVSCKEEQVHTYCTEERYQHTAFLFRGGKEFLSFDLDTVFDVNSIVSEVLFAILREEVKYVHTDADLLSIERAVRGKRDIVLGYVRSLGTQEHRSLMETAYVYGSKYQFILITGGPVLKQLEVNESSLLSRVWFLHCGAFMSSERCPLTLMRTALSTLNLYSFLQLMEAPLLSQVYVDPSSVPPPQFPYQLTPQVFLFSRPETEHLDLDSASALAWRLRGVALLLLVHRQSPAVQTPDEYNAAYRLPEKSPEVRYLTLHSLDDVLELFTDQEEAAEEEEDEDEEEDSRLERLDDEVAATVFEHRADLLDLDSVTQLTAENFQAAVARSRLTVALFYLRWDAVSSAFLSSFIEAAERLSDSEVDGVQMAVVDCGEWTDLCSAQVTHVPFQPITAFPSVLLLRPQQPVQLYRGMLGSEALLRFILISLTNAPLLLTQEDVASFLQEVPHPELAGYRLDRILGLFRTDTETGVSEFTEAAESLRGEVLSGLLTDQQVDEWSADHQISPPVVLVFPSWRTRPSVLPVSTSVKELLTHVKAALLPPLPELTVESLPSVLSLGRALLLLFVGEEEDDIGWRQNQMLLKEMRGLTELGGEEMERYQTCWIHLGHTPAATSILESYLGSLPPLPALVLTHIPSRQEVFQFPPSAPIGASSVLQWLQKVEEGAESPAGMLGEDRWPPAFDFYDFLKVLDLQDLDSAEQKDGGGDVEEEVNVEEHLITGDVGPKVHSEL